MPPAIRPAVPADAAPLAAFAARTFTDAFGALNDPTDLATFLATAYGAAQQGREIADPAMRTFVAEAEGVLAGFAQLRQGRAAPCVTGPRPIELYRFYVDRAFHGQGLAQALMARVVAEAEALGAATLWLGTWEVNARGIAFYGKVGFTAVGHQTFQVGADLQRDVVMSRPLAGA